MALASSFFNGAKAPLPLLNSLALDLEQGTIMLNTPLENRSYAQAGGNALNLFYRLF